MRTVLVFVCAVLVPLAIAYPSNSNQKGDEVIGTHEDVNLVRVVRSPNPEPFHGGGFGGGRGFGGGFGRGFGGPRFGGGFAPPPPFFYRRRRPYYYGGPGYYGPGYGGGSGSFAIAVAGSGSFYGK